MAYYINICKGFESSPLEPEKILDPPPRNVFGSAHIFVFGVILYTIRPYTYATHVVQRVLLVPGNPQVIEVSILFPYIHRVQHNIRGVNYAPIGVLIFYRFGNGKDEFITNVYKKDPLSD